MRTLLAVGAQPVFGGSRIFDIAYWLDRLVTCHVPVVVVVFAGTNDIQGDAPRSGAWVAERFDELVTRLRALGCAAPPVYRRDTDSGGARPISRKPSVADAPLAHTRATRSQPQTRTFAPWLVMIPSAFALGSAATPWKRT